MQIQHVNHLENVTAKFKALLAHFDAKFAGLGLEPKSREAAEIGLKFIREATRDDWEAVRRAAGLKSRPNTTIAMLRQVFVGRLGRAVRL